MKKALFLLLGSIAWMNLSCGSDEASGSNGTDDTDSATDGDGTDSASSGTDDNGILPHEVLTLINTTTIRGFGVDDSGVFWCETSGKLYFLPTGETEPVLILSHGPDDIWCLVKEGYLYWHDDDEQILWRVTLPLDVNAPFSGDSDTESDTSTDTESDTSTDTESDTSTDTESDNTGGLQIFVAMERQALFRGKSWGSWVTDDAYFYYFQRSTNETPHQLLRVPLGAEGPGEVLATDISVKGLALHSGYLYFGNFYSDYVERIPVEGGTPENVMFVYGGAEDILIHGDMLLASTYFDGIFRMDLLLNSKAENISSAREAYFEEIEGDMLYFWKSDILRSVPVSGGTTTSYPIGKTSFQLNAIDYHRGAIYAIVEIASYSDPRELWKVEL